MSCKTEYLDKKFEYSIKNTQICYNIGFEANIEKKNPRITYINKNLIFMCLYYLIDLKSDE
jgi:hypothetical protein